MRLKDVNNLTEDQGRNWSRFIQQQKSLSDFLKSLSDWDGLVDDVVGIVGKWTDKDFEDFKKCIAIEKKGIFSGEANAIRFSAVQMPYLLFKATIISLEFKCPWGLAVLRLREHDPKVTP